MNHDALRGPTSLAMNLLLGILVIALPLSAEEETTGPRYSSPEARSLIERMISAHGGMEAWRAAPTVSFTRKATFAANPAHPWILEEIIEQNSRRLYQTWPVDEAQLVYDGEEVWTVNWVRPYPPRFVAQIGFYFLNLPWITQDPGVILDGPDRGSHPASELEYLTVAMSFEPGTGDTPRDRYVLYIDPESYLLRAIEYHVSYGALLDASYLPPAVKTIGPFFHVNHDFEVVDGLQVPVRYNVYEENGSRSISGEVHSWSFSRPFDLTKLQRPAQAVTDESNPRRRVE
jgi:hypothetical protein